MRDASGRREDSKLLHCVAEHLSLGIARTDRRRQAAPDERELIQRANGMLEHGIFSLRTPYHV